MKNLKLKYNFLGIPFLPVWLKREVPEFWSELDYDQFLCYIRHIYLHSSSIMVETKDDEGEVKIRIDETELVASMIPVLKSVLRIKFWLFAQLTLEQVKELIFDYKIADFLVITPPEKLMLQPKLGPYYAPDLFDRMVAIEFAFVDGFYLKYKEIVGENPSWDIHLVKFVAQIYRKKKRNYDPESPDHDGDVREPYNNLTDKPRIDHFERYSLEELLAVLIVYEQWRKVLPRRFKHVFTNKSARKVRSSGTWIPVIISLGGGAVNWEKSKRMNAMILLAELDQKLKVQKDIESKGK